jgi:hypothetical protein
MSCQEPERLVPELEALLKLWRRRYGVRPLPDRSLLTPGDLTLWSRNIVVIDHTADDRFYIRTFGIDLIRRFGRESTGHGIDDLARDIRESLRRCLRQCLSAEMPVAASSSVKLGRHVARFCELAVPLAPASLLLASYELHETG